MDALPVIKRMRRRISVYGSLEVIAIVLVVFAIATLLFPPRTSGIRKAKQSAVVQQSHILTLALYCYAMDHDGHYPDGASSTEVFQKLLNQQYISDLSVFYIQCHGKLKPTAAQKILKPENVCWDFTSGVSLTSPEKLPLVFQT